MDGRGPQLFCCTDQRRYRWLDRLLPGTAARTVARKVGLDMLVFALPYYTAFYTSLNLLAGKPVSSSIAELRSQANTCHMLHKMHSQPK